ncbi:hypothetical protein G6M50_06350 [Agrobacterium rhizogenes]|nr:hypothetical protein [Rhizobium rhizogenes]NTJ77424.1 hypothetical protein [Rhizobium rhizogenes]
MIEAACDAYANGDPNEYPSKSGMKDALTAALALLPGEPVGWRWKLPSDDFWQFKDGPERPRLGLPTKTEASAIIEPLYAAPAPQPVSVKALLDLSFLHTMPRELLEVVVSQLSEDQLSTLRRFLYPAYPSSAEIEALRVENDPLAWMRLGARAMRLSARATCGNHWESSQEGAMTSGGLSKLDKEKLYAEANASEEISRVISETCEDSALGYASYMGDDADKQALAKLGVTSDWLYRRHSGEPSRKELAASATLQQQEEGK